MCLVRTPVRIGLAELFVIVYVINVGAEQIRKVSSLEVVPIDMRLFCRYSCQSRKRLRKGCASTVKTTGMRSHYSLCLCFYAVRSCVFVQLLKTL